MSSEPFDENPFDADHPTGRMPFAFRAVPDPMPFEPAHAWVHRAAFMNGQPSFETLAFQLGLNPARLGPRTCLALALASDPPKPEMLIANTPVVRGHRVTFGTESVSIKNWSISFRRYCPACLEESPHHRFFWDISFFCECPFHGMVLKGGKGREGVTWSSSDMRFSPDGRWLPGHAPSLGTPKRSMEGYLLGRLGVSKGFAAPILDRSPLDEVAYCVPLLGSLLARCGERIRHSANRLALGPQIVSVGFAALAETEDQLVEQLVRRAEATLKTLDPRAEAGLGTLFGRIGDVFASARRMALAREILEAMRVAVARIGRLRTLDSSYGRLLSGPPPSFGLKQLAQMTAIPVGTVRILLELGGVQKAAAGQPPRLYTAEDANLVRAVSEQAVPARRVAEILGLRVRYLYALETAGILRTVFYDVTTGKRAKRFHLPDAHLIADRFGRDVEPTVPSVSFKTFAETLRITPGELARGVVTGEFVPVGRRGRGCCFSGMRFAGVTDKGSVAPGMSAREAGQRLEVSFEVLKWLCSAGHLATASDNLRNGGVSIADVQRLEQLYVSTRVLASRMGVAFGAKAACLLASRGVGMLRATSGSTGLALRADIEALDPNLLASSETDRAWAVLRKAAGSNCGPWRFPTSAKGDHVRIAMTAHKVSLVLEFGASMTMTVDCSSQTNVRRWRIIEPRLAELPDLLPNFRLVQNGGGETLLSSVVPLTQQRTIDANAVHWFRSNLFALAAVFGARAAGRPPEPERERRVAEQNERRREWAKTLATTHPRKRGGGRRAASDASESAELGKAALTPDG